MRWGAWAAVAVVVGWLGCGTGGSLPTGDEGTPTPGTDGPVALPGNPVDPGTGTPPTNPDPGNPPAPPDPGPPSAPPPPSLWPLTTGSTWTYRIDDPKLGVFQKVVTVQGVSEVPDTGGQVRGVQVHSHQTRLSQREVYEEWSWQLALDTGLVVRLREEDFLNGTRLRVTTWSTASQMTATVKSLAREQPPGWTHTDTVTEHTRLGDGSLQQKERTYQWRVAAVAERVTTPAGTFTNAVRLVRSRLDKESKERTYWLVPGIGKVKEDGERLEELESYSVKP